jgi:hypothetical protein
MSPDDDANRRLPAGVISQMKSDTAETPATTKKPLLSGPKRQHFLPKFYLEGFTRDGNLAVYDRESDDVRVQTPVNTGVIGHFYTMKDEEGRKRYELEAFLSEWEGKASVIMTKLSNSENISVEERVNLSIFIALAAFRTPEHVQSIMAVNSGFVGAMALEMFGNVERAKEQMRRTPFAPETEEDLDREARDLVAFAQGGRYEIKTEHKWAVEMAIRTAFAVAPTFADRDWLILHRPDHKRSFVATDSPVLLTTVAPREPSMFGVGFGNADALIIFPLDQTCALAMFGDRGGLAHIASTDERMRHINLAIADRCQRFVIGRDRSIVRSLADRLSLGSKKWSPKMQASRFPNARAS